MTKLFRVIDANLNRIKEGIRVLEDISRYELNNPISSNLKDLRHKIKFDFMPFLSCRDSKNDILRNSTKTELLRSDVNDILSANFKRCQESARVLEECFKLYDIERSEFFKMIRYELYEFEKEFKI